MTASALCRAASAMHAYGLLCQRWFSESKNMLESRNVKTQQFWHTVIRRDVTASTQRPCVCGVSMHNTTVPGHSINGKVVAGADG